MAVVLGYFVGQDSSMTMMVEPLIFVSMRSDNHCHGYIWPRHMICPA